MLTVSIRNYTAVLLSVMSVENQIPLVRSLHLITKDFFGALTRMLIHLDIDRYFYCLLKIVRHQKGITQKDLVQLMDVDKVTMSRMIDYLVQKDYVFREAFKDDRRTIMLYPTPKACSESIEIRAAIETLEDQAFSGISKEMKDQILSALVTIQSNMSQLPKELVKFNYSKINK